jgi:hypothetical protein
MESPSRRIAGHLLLKGQTMDLHTREIIMVFLGQLSAVTQNKL